MTEYETLKKKYLDMMKNGECNSNIIQQVLQQEAKIALPIPDSVIDKYMKIRNETIIENRSLNKLANDLNEVLRKSYPDMQSLSEKGQIGPLSYSQMAELGINIIEFERPITWQYADYESYKNRVITEAKVRERAYIEAKRQQWIEDRIVQRVEDCRNKIIRGEPLINRNTYSNNHNLINTKNLKNAVISNFMENFNELKKGLRKT